jgi:hypothetical protein
MSHAPQGGQAPDQANSGHQTGVAALTQTDHSEGTPKQRPIPRRVTCSTTNTRLATAPDRPTRRVSQSPELGENLDVPVRAVQADPLPVLDQPGCMLDPDDGR